MANRHYRLGFLKASCVVLVLSSMLFGCSRDEDLSVLKSGDVYVLVASKDAGKDSAGTGVSGRVSMVGDCLGIDGTTTLWPEGTRIVHDAPLTIDVPGVGELEVGASVSGEAIGYSDQPPTGPEAIPSGCPSDGLIAFQPD